VIGIGPRAYLWMDAWSLNSGNGADEEDILALGSICEGARIPSSPKYHIKAAWVSISIRMT
jgi:hypothetical protein